MTISEQVDLNWDWKLERTQTSGYCFENEQREFSNFKCNGESFKLHLTYTDQQVTLSEKQSKQNNRGCVLTG